MSTILLYTDPRSWLQEPVRRWAADRGHAIIETDQWEPEMDIEYLLSAGHRFRIKDEELKRARVALNLHPAPLPEWSGARPLIRMEACRFREGGITIHRMTDIPDAGPIIVRRNFWLPEDQWEWGVRKWLDTYGDIVRGLLPSVLDCAIPRREEFWYDD